MTERDEKWGGFYAAEGNKRNVVGAHREPLRGCEPGDARLRLPE